MSLKKFIASYFPFSSRGFLVLLFALWLVLFPARLEADIVAAVSGLTLLALILIFGIASLVLSLNIRKRLEIELSSNGAGGSAREGAADGLNKERLLQSGIFAREPATIVLKLSNLNLTPFSALRLSIEFSADLPRTEHEVLGGSSSIRFLTEQVTFPHRGNWQVRLIRCSLQDRIGLTRIRWQVETPEIKKCFLVRPPLLNDSSLPILSSANRAGEEVLDLHERRGEDFDLKRYHPADGMRKILWKVYAKSGQLMSRHPERSMTPEGKVLMYCVAGPRDDGLCSRALAYIGRLEEIDLQPIFGCSGMLEREPVFSGADAEALLIETVWNSGQGARPADLEKIISAATKGSTDTRVESLLVFFSSTANQAEGLIALGTFLETRGIKPIFVPDAASRFRSPAAGRKSPAGTRNAYLESALELFVEKPVNKVKEAPPGLDAFLRSCATKNWLVINGAQEQRGPKPLF